MLVLCHFLPQPDFRQDLPLDQPAPKIPFPGVIDVQCCAQLFRGCWKFELRSSHLYSRCSYLLSPGPEHCFKSLAEHEQNY